MNESKLELRWQPLAAVALAAATAFILMLSVTSSASAKYIQFCWGAHVSGGSGVSTICDSLYHDGVAGYIDEVGGSGTAHSVCVLAWLSEGTEMCSAGPNQGVYNFSPQGKIQSVGQIRNNAAGDNTVSAFLETCATACNGGAGSPPPPKEPSWHSDNLGGTLTSDPDISTWGTNRLDVFARGSEGSLWHDYYTGAWSGWTNMGGSIVGGPSAASWLNRIDVVNRISNNTVQHWFWDGASWASDNLGGTTSADPSISSWGPNRLDVFARGSEGALLHKYWAGAGWSGWENMGGSIVGGPSAASWSTNRIDVVARGTNNSVEHWYWTGAGWGHDNLGGTITSDPDISSWGTNRFDIFARGSNGSLWHKYYDSGYSGWADMGGEITGGPGTVSWAPGRLDVVARDAGNNSIDHWYYTP